MKRAILTCCLVLVAGVIGYFVGVIRESIRSSEENMAQTMHHWDQFAELDREFLQTIPATENTLTPGVYLMETWFLNHKPTVHELTLKIHDGKIMFPASASPHRLGIAETFWMTGNVVMWLDEGILYEANAKYVGHITGSEMYGRVYGWNPGDESIGFWRIYPKSAKSAEP